MLYTYRIERWSKELDAFSTVDSMIREGKNLFQIYERLRALNPDVLRLHHATIEKEYMEFKAMDTDRSKV